MPRKPRLHFPGALFHVMARGNARQTIFIDDADYRTFLLMLADAKRRFPFRLYASCLMPNHLHLLMEAGALPISVAMHLLLTGYSVYFNRRHIRSGHVFQDRFKSILCDRDPYLLALLRYIPLNPVRAGLVKDPAEWPWSSHREYLSRRGTGLIDTAFPLSLFGEDDAEARRKYREFVVAGIGRGHEPAFYPDKPFLGPRSESFAKENGFLPAAPSRGALEEICHEVSRGAGMSADAIRSRVKTRLVVEARRLVICQATERGFRENEIAEFIGCGISAVSKVLARRLGKLGNT